MFNNISTRATNVFIPFTSFINSTISTTTAGQRVIIIIRLLLIAESIQRVLKKLNRQKQITVLEIWND